MFHSKNFLTVMALFGAAPSFDLEILGVLNANILPISRNIGGAVAPPHPQFLGPYKVFLNKES